MKPNEVERTRAITIAVMEAREALSRVGVPFDAFGVVIRWADGEFSFAGDASAGGILPFCEGAPKVVREWCAQIRAGITPPRNTH